MNIETLLGRLREFDLLLDTDPLLPSVSGIVAGSPVRGSWWSHPRARLMYKVALELHHHTDVLLIRLVSRKLTYVHRNLWPAVLSVGTARDAWQLKDLSKPAKQVLDRLDRDASLRATGDSVRELEHRLLARCESVHTEKGSHAKQLQSWTAWAQTVGLDGPGLSSADGKAQLESTVRRLNGQFQGQGKLPWAGRTIL